MAGLLDIVPQKETVNIRGVEVEVTGINIGSITLLLGRFPELATMIAAREFTIAKVLSHGPDLVGGIIAAGTGYPNDDAAEAIAKALSADDQALLLAPIFRITMPRGLGPFVEVLVEIAKSLGMRPSQDLSAGVEKISGSSRMQSKPSSHQATAA